MKLSIIPPVLAFGIVLGGIRVAYASDPAPPPEPVGTHTVEPGDCHLNSDGVEVCVDSGSGGDMKINPKTGSSTSATTVDVLNDSEGTVKGIDGNDTVNVANGAQVDIEGTGGTVDITAGGSSGSIKNTAGPGGADITVKTSGDELKVPPGSTLKF